MSRSVTFVQPWGKRSWLVQHELNGAPFLNDRQPHVELGQGNMDKVKAGDTFALTNPHVVSGRAVVFDLVGLNKGTEPAHFTVYFGQDAATKLAAYM